MATDNDLFEASQASAYLEDTSGFGASKGVVPYMSPNTIRQNEGLGKQNPIKKANGEYVFPSDFTDWQAEMVNIITDAVTNAVAASLANINTAVSKAEAAQQNAETAAAATSGSEAAASLSATLAADWANYAIDTDVPGQPTGSRSARHYSNEASIAADAAAISESNAAAAASVYFPSVLIEIRLGSLVKFKDINSYGHPNVGLYHFNSPTIKVSDMVVITPISNSAPSSPIVYDYTITQIGNAMSLDIEFRNSSGLVDTDFVLVAYPV